MTRLVRQSRAVRKSQVLSDFVERKAELQEATVDYDKAYTKLNLEATRVLRLYAPLKNAVSNRDWSRKHIKNIKITNMGKMIELALCVDFYSQISYWRFPSWMIGSTDERIVEGLKKIIQEDAERFAQYETDKLEAIRLKELAQLEETRLKELAQLQELKLKYPETIH